MLIYQTVNLEIIRSIQQEQAYNGVLNPDSETDTVYEQIMHQNQFLDRAVCVHVFVPTGSHK